MVSAGRIPYSSLLKLAVQSLVSPAKHLRRSSGSRKNRLRNIVPSAQRKALTARRDSINVPASTSLHPFLSALGAGVAQISLTRPELLRKAVRHVASFCTGLRHLSIELDSRWQSGRLRTLLAARGAELEVLEVEISDILSVCLVAGI